MTTFSKDLWSGTLSIEGGNNQTRITIESKSTNGGTVSVDLSDQDLDELIKHLLSRRPNNLPSAHTIGDAVFFNLWEKQIVAEVHAVHFTQSKVKYDLNLLSDDGYQTRIYNVDSAFVTKSKD